MSGQEKMDRRSALKIVGGTIAGLVVGGAIGYLAKPAAPAVTSTVTSEITKTITKATTKTVAKGAATVTKTITTTVTGTATPAVGGIKWQLPPGEKNPTVDFSGVTLKSVFDAGIGHLIEWFKDELKSECGVTMADPEYNPMGQQYQKTMTDLLSGKPSWHLVQVVAMYLGDYVKTEKVQALDKYLSGFANIDAFWADIVPPFREYYCKWGGKTWALPFDGDIHVFNYRPSLFRDDKLKRKFKEKYGRPLTLPQTWDDALILAKFFQEETGLYGMGMVGQRPFNYGWWLDFAAAYGVMYFDEEMEHAFIPRDRAIEASEMFYKFYEEEVVPPGTPTMDISETVTLWQSAKVAMFPWWVDLNEFTARTECPVRGDLGDTLMPGAPDPKWGTIIHRPLMHYGRIFIIPTDIPEECKKAAVYVMVRLASKYYSVYYVADPFCGSDPFLFSHYTEEAAMQYCKPNPYRGTAPDWPVNEGIFKDPELARKHVLTAKQNLENGFPQPCWPGSAKYIDSLSIHVQKLASGEESPKEFVNNVAADWESIRDELGKSEQKEYWKSFVETSKKLGYWPRA